MKRALRRYHKCRMKEKAKKVFPDYDKAHTLGDHLKNCSCDMCCNPRRSGWCDERTRAEIKFDMNAVEQETTTEAEKNEGIG